MSTHFKSISVLLLYFIFHLSTSVAQVKSDKMKESEWEAFPILNYDSDVGFGYGAKGFFYNFLQQGESFDLTAYNSTKGERWYRFVFSFPDMQRRLGTKYNLAFDLIIDYDKWINYNYYFDSQGSYSDELGEENFEKYIREPIEVSGVFSRAITSKFITELGLQYKSISCYRFDEEGQLRYKKPQSVQHLSLLLNFRIDTRSNFLSPTNGILIQLNNQYAYDLLNEGQSFYKVGLTLQSYLNITNHDLILASRIIYQHETETSYQNLLPVGGNSSVRGLPQDRYLSESMILINEELRFPIIWRLSGVLGIDVANSKSTPHWIINPVLGLRFNMDNFIVRADLGFGKESTGFYFNFGHLF